ncbi:unnamed protein product [Mytilus edulis]|uniref:Uncharacterized protein n=1 Tax=Mytilus edulis TaxID=6550 RepID=A0A8S3R9U2_MYTED|nr:unnamed protein product [Mytilus edulis]
MTWYEGYDYCVGANKRLVYVMSDFSQLETERLLYLKEVSASLNVRYTKGKVRNRRKSRPATIRQKSPRDGADEEVSVGRTTMQANTGETSLTDLPSLVTSDETVSAERTTTPANNGETSSTDLSSIVTSDETVSAERTTSQAYNGPTSSTDLPSLVTSDETVSAERTTTPANNGETSSTDLSSIVTSDETVSAERTTSQANNGPTSSTDLSTLVTSEENVSIGRTATTANNRETSLADLSLLVTPDKNVSDGRKVSRAGNGEKTLGGQVHTTAGAVIGIMSSFVIIYNAAPLLKGIFKRVPKTADGDLRQGEVEDQVADTIAIAMSGIDDRILFTRRIDKWSVPPINHSDVVS